MAKKFSFGTNFGKGAKKNFHKFYLYHMLDIVASYHSVQFQRKLRNQTWENSKKPNFGTDFSPLGPN